ncbi:MULTISPECIES: rhodanese-like domain-containing protein [Planktothrix]|jgi:rhodanese-related sulfurtransferase|nr:MULTISPECIES: rhodanese-like domain-containing protein [Planktothrix]CAD5972486.1 Rhodanese-like/PpiC domain-containing protein 12, chloroplastic [Planktothrix rubescens]MBG0746094.1 rhodanese-related sulfurtransferase [Planktothrix agardhii KL2]MCF3570603.1 rhodanese-related sulfurtransferase [Planktothrix agardhii 1805]MCF3586351.1 rhodanese-related sulfurtransferase [Planktothrix agardhii 1803]MCF3603214.1 rhodanese-related sulfurtransferase [Planktothrix agardhii 1804]
MSEQFFTQAIPEISVKQLENLLKTVPETDLQLIDVREPQEIEMAKIEGFINYPLSQYSAWSDQILVQLDPHQETLILCHHGMRSAQMCQWLIQKGFTQVKNINGGIDAYSVLVDSQIPRY